MMDPGFGRPQDKIIFQCFIIFFTEPECQEERPPDNQNSRNIIRCVQIVNTKIRFKPRIREMISPKVAPVLVRIQDLGVRLHYGECHFKESIPGQQVS